MRKFLTLLLLPLWSATSAADTSPDVDTLRSMADSARASAMARYMEFLGLPNVASSPDDIRALVDWLDQEFRTLGFETEELPTAANPALFASRQVDAEAKTVLIYLQADGQPVDPAAWQQDDPFEPVLKQKTGDAWEIIEQPSNIMNWNREWRVFARSASDSKGPMAQFMAAIDVLNQNDIAPAFNLKVIIDTEEELGSPHLAELVKARRDLLAADMLIIFDGPPHASGNPTVSFGARGLTSVTLTTYGPVVPQHSGHYGNFVPNPGFDLARILASLKSPEGKVLIEEFYRGVEFDDATKDILSAVPDDEDAILGGMGVSQAEQVAPSLQEALQFPSLNIRGMASAWVGQQTRTIIPATATAEIDIRLVKESDPEFLVAQFKKHVESLGYTVLADAPTMQQRLDNWRVVTMTSSTNYRAYRSDLDGEAGMLARRAMIRLHGQEPILIRTMGGSIPIAPFVEVLDIPTATVPTVNIDNNQHSPNENLRVADFFEGIVVMLAVLTEQAQ